MSVNNFFKELSKSVLFLGLTTQITAQTWIDVTATAPYSALQLNGAKDGGHSWSDFDLEGGLNLLVNLSSGSKLLRNSAGTFVDDSYYYQWDDWKF